MFPVLAGYDKIKVPGRRKCARRGIGNEERECLGRSIGNEERECARRDIGNKERECSVKSMEKKLSHTVSVEEIQCAGETMKGCTAEQILAKKLGLTKHQIKSAKFRPGGICVNGQQARITQQLKAGDEITVLLEEEKTSSAHLEAVPGPVDILYEDEDVIAVNKPAGLPVHPAHGHYRDTLANYLMYYFEQKGKRVCIRAVGRLDKDTSGIVVFAKNQVAAARLSEGHAVKKEYRALVRGHLNPMEGSIVKPIGKKRNTLNEMEISEKGKYAKTNYRVLRVLEDYSLVSLKLETGRTHQIRVHMAALGNPLLGDPIYGGADSGERKVSEKEVRTGEHALEQAEKAGGYTLEQAEKEGGYALAQEELRRAALHCHRVVLRQPFSGETVEIEAALPEDMAAFLQGQSKEKEDRSWSRKITQLQRMQEKEKQRREI